MTLQETAQPKKNRGNPKIGTLDACEVAKGDWSEDGRGDGKKRTKHIYCWWYWKQADLHPHRDRNTKTTEVSQGYIRNAQGHACRERHVCIADSI